MELKKSKRIKFGSQKIEELLFKLFLDLRKLE